LITVNGKKSSGETRIKNQDVIGHQIHRHEPPVSEEAIKIIARTDGYIVIDKPGSIPVRLADVHLDMSVYALY
jgi:tRNA pseudouridine synthase 9